MYAHSLIHERTCSKYTYQCSSGSTCLFLPPAPTPVFGYSTTPFSSIEIDAFCRPACDAGSSSSDSTSPRCRTRWNGWCNRMIIVKLSTLLLCLPLILANVLCKNGTSMVETGGAYFEGCKSAHVVFLFVKNTFHVVMRSLVDHLPIIPSNVRHCSRHFKWMETVYPVSRFLCLWSAVSWYKSNRSQWTGHIKYNIIYTYTSAQRKYSFQSVRSHLYARALFNIVPIDKQEIIASVIPALCQRSTRSRKLETQISSTFSLHHTLPHFINSFKEFIPATFGKVSVCG